MFPHKYLLPTSLPESRNTSNVQSTGFSCIVEPRNGVATLRTIQINHSTGNAVQIELQCSWQIFSHSIRSLRVYNSIHHSENFVNNEFVAKKSTWKHLITICSEDFSPPSERYAAYSITIPFFLSAFFCVCFVLFFFSMVETAHNHWWWFRACVLASFWLRCWLRRENLKYYEWEKQALEGLKNNYFSHFSIGCHSFIMRHQCKFCFDSNSGNHGRWVFRRFSANMTLKWKFYYKLGKWDSL